MARPSESESARRLLAILHLFKRDGGEYDQKEIPLSEIASMLNISVKQAESDIERLACCGSENQQLPIYIENGMVVVWNDLPSLEHPLRLSTAETRALAAALEVAGISKNDPLRIRLLEATADGELDVERLSNFVRSDDNEGVGEVLKQISLAIEEHHVVTISYLGTKSTTVETRSIEPLQLLFDKEKWYLEAFCRQAAGLRTFRIDRISEVLDTKKCFADRRLPIASKVMPLDGLPNARIRVDSNQVLDEREWPGYEIESQEGDSMIITIPYSGTSWIARRVVARLGSVEVIEPPEVIEAVVALARRLRNEIE